MEKLITHLKWISLVIGIVGAIWAAAEGYFRLEGRVTNLEREIKELKGAPKHPGSPEGIVERCVELSKQYEKASAEGHSFQASDANANMLRLGCDTLR